MFKSNNLRRSLSAPNLNIYNRNASNLNISHIFEAFKGGNFTNNNLSETQFRKLVKKLATSESKPNLVTDVESNMSLKESHKRIELIRVSHLSSMNTEDKLNDYLSRLNSLYVGFKSLKTNPKYLRQIFGDDLVELFRERAKTISDESHASMQENIHYIFSG